MQGFLIGAVTTLVVSGLLLVWFLDHRYENQSSIKPEEMESLLPIVEQEHADGIVPCDADGRPVEQPASQ